MKSRSLITLLAATAVTAAVPASAHHSFAAEFDANQPVEIEGEITKVEWANPHIWLYLDVTDDAGTVSNWRCEGGTPNSLRRFGWSADTLVEGDDVRIEGWRARDGTDTCNARVIMKGDQRLFAGSSNPNQ